MIDAMITTKYVRDNIDTIRESLRRRKSAFPIDELLNLDREWRALETELQGLRAERNKKSMEVSKAKKSGGSADSIIAEMSGLKKRVSEIEKRMPACTDRMEALLWNLPNTLHNDVPAGNDGSDNPEIKRVGGIMRESSDAHEDILERLGLIDIESAAKVAGSRFYYLKGEIVLLEQSMLRFALDTLAGKGFAPVIPPFILRKRYYRGVVPLGNFEEMLYSAAEPAEAGNATEYERLDDELFLIATAEHPLAAMHAGKVLKGTDLPLRYAGISPSFRREAGAHGKDTKGIFRVHQFNKVEQFILSREEDSWEHYDELLRNSEEIISKLGIPYRVVEICTGDMSSKDSRSHDIEGYMPSQRVYRELFSCSNCTDWQSTRLDIKYDMKGERKYVHTLNATGLSAERMLVAIVENYVNDDGTITVPDVLVPYMNKRVIGSA